MHHPVFTVGQGRQCDLSIGDPSISKTLCNLRCMESEVCSLREFGIDGYLCTINDTAKHIYTRVLLWFLGRKSLGYFTYSHGWKRDR